MSGERAEMILRLTQYLEVLDEHITLITRMHDDGVIPTVHYDEEIAMFAGERDLIEQTLEHLVAHNST